MALMNHCRVFDGMYKYRYCLELLEYIVSIIHGLQSTFGGKIESKRLEATS